MSWVSSGARTADATITQKSGSIIGAIELIGSGATDCNVIAYDAVLAASADDANMLGKVAIDASLEGNATTKLWNPAEPVRVNNGIFCNVTGAGGAIKYIVYYKR